MAFDVTAPMPTATVEYLFDPSHNGPMRPEHRYRTTISLLDLTGLLAIGGVLVAVHFLVPSPLQEQLAFHHDLTHPQALLTSAYVHNSDAHLWSNLLGYVAAAGYTYVICAGLGERRWFWLTTLTLLTVLPALVNLASFSVFRIAYPQVSIPASRGFSGVAAGFAGFLYVAALVLVRTAYGRQAATSAGLVLFAALAGEVLVIYAETPPLVGGALVALLVGLAAFELVRDAYPESVPTGREAWVTLAGVGVQLTLVGVMLGVLMVGLFPSDLVVDGTFRNIFAHGSGLVFGGVIAGWGYRYWGRGVSTSRQ